MYIMQGFVFKKNDFFILSYLCNDLEVCFAIKILFLFKMPDFCRLCCLIVRTLWGEAI